MRKLELIKGKNKLWVWLRHVYVFHFHEMDIIFQNKKCKHLGESI